jgi:hypothetical protein
LSALQWVHSALWAAAGFRSSLVGSLDKPVGWFLGGVPLDHLPSANITINAAAVGNGQFGIAHEVQRPAVPTDKVIAKGECWGGHRSIICASVAQYASGCGGDVAGRQLPAQSPQKTLRPCRTWRIDGKDQLGSC